MTTEKIKWHNGSVNEILVASMSGINGPHPQKLKMDEVELIPWTILQEAFSTVQSKNGVESVMILGSTRKFAAGPMQRLVEDSIKRGNIKLFQWCIWETVEALPSDEREVARIKETFGDYLPENVDQCSGYYTWADLIETFRTLDRNVWETQWDCKRADTQGLVYSRFDDTLNIAADFNLDMVSLQNGWSQVYIFEDFGTSKDHPDVILFAHVDFKKEEVIIFDELYSVDKGLDDILADFYPKLESHGLTLQNISGWIGDPHNPAEQMNRYNKGLPMLGNHFVKDSDQKLAGELYIIKNGISHVRKFIDDRRLKLTPNVVEYRGEIMSYAYAKKLDGTYKDEAEKKNDHGNDACRYGLIWLFPTQATGSFGADDLNPSEKEDFRDIPFTAGLMEKKF
jgi:hypothetical protein